MWQRKISYCIRSLGQYIYMYSIQQRFRDTGCFQFLYLPTYVPYKPHDDMILQQTTMGVKMV